MHATIGDELYFEHQLNEFERDCIIRLAKSGYFNQYMPKTSDALLLDAYEAGWTDAMDEAASALEGSYSWRSDSDILRRIKHAG